jgi:phosphoribosyl 1,2-cyclic phosphate phosphodiesterase
MDKEATITFLGTGTSQGIPMIACDCNVCKSMDFRDKRFRTSIHIGYKDQSIVIDSGPDFRMQMLRHRVPKLDAIVFTHEHKDHIAGLDDVRGFNYKQQVPMPLYGRQRILDRLKVEFAYAFGDNKVQGVPELQLHPIETDIPFQLGELSILPIEIMHYKLPIHGFRLGDFMYITDGKTIAPDQLELIRGVKTLVLNGLQEEPHNSHFTLAEALAIIEELKPEVAYLTHISHRLGEHAVVEATKLPKNVFLAYDGLQVQAIV